MKSYFQKIIDKFNLLSDRERKVVIVGALFLIPFFGYRFVFIPIQDYNEELIQKVSLQEKNIDKIKLLTKEYRFLTRKTKFNKIPLAQRVSTLTKKYQQALQSQISVSEKENDFQSIVLKLDKINLKDLIGLLYLFESQKPIIRVEKAEISSSLHDNTLLRTTLTLESL